jgi:hypothetical protein
VGRRERGEVRLNVRRGTREEEKGKRAQKCRKRENNRKEGERWCSG